MEEYNEELQKVFLRFFITESDLWARAQPIVRPEYFHKSLKKVVQFLKEFSSNYNGVPNTDQIKAKTRSSNRKD